MAVALLAAVGCASDRTGGGGHDRVGAPAVAPDLGPGCPGPPEPAAERGGTRDAALWPFSRRSPWNTPLGTGAAYAPDDDPRSRTVIGLGPTAWVNAEAYSQPVYLATGHESIGTMRETGCPDARMRLPSGVRPAAGTDANINVIDPSRSYVDECWSATAAWPVVTCARHERTDLHGMGFGEAGTRASGASALGGLIRLWELERGAIGHALAMAMPGSALQRGPVWPATTEDDNAPDNYRGPIPMGTLLALPAGLDIDALGLSPGGMVVARALRSFGAYVVDQSERSVAIYAEPGADPGLVDSLRGDWARLLPLLRPVTNNSPETPGGPGDRITPPPDALR